MTKSISEQDVGQTLFQVKNPTIDRTLIGPGILKNITIRNGKDESTLSFPFLKISVRDYLAFSAMEKKSWKGISYAGGFNGIINSLWYR